MSCIVDETGHTKYGVTHINVRAIDETCSVERGKLDGNTEREECVWWWLGPIPSDSVKFLDDLSDNNKDPWMYPRTAYVLGS